MSDPAHQLDGEHEREKPPRHPLLKLNPWGVTPINRWGFSASQIDTWRLCHRKWGYAYVDRIKGKNRFAERGLEVHRHIENWLADGIDPPEDERYGKLARTGIKHLPLPGESEIERKFEFISRRGLRWKGAIDVNHFNRTMMRRPKVFDHKSTTGKKWALKPEELRTNIQAVIYGLVAAFQHEHEEVDLEWLYYIDTKKPRCVPVFTTVSIEHLLFEFDAIEETAFEIIREGQIKAEGEASTLPAEPRSCEKYGGCPHRQRCPITDAEKLEAIMEQMSVRDRLLNKSKANGAATASAPAQSAAPAQQPPPQAAAPAQQTPAKTAAPAQQPPAQSSAPSALERMKAQAAAAAAKSPAQVAGSGASVTNIQTAARPAAPPAQQAAPKTAAAPAPTNTATTPTVAPPPGSLLERLKLRTQGGTVTSQPPATGAPQSDADRVEAAGLAAAEEALKAAEQEAETQTQESNAPVSFEASDVNPPEKPETPIDDPDVLAQQQPPATKGKAKAAEGDAADGEKKKRGRPVGSTNVKTSDGEAIVFAHGYAAGLAAFKDPETAQLCALDALQTFREAAQQT